MADEDFGHFVEMAALLAATLLLGIAELIGGFLELAGEARAVEAQPGEERDLCLGVGGLGEQVGFEEWDAVETPGGIGDFVNELSLSGVGGGVLIEKLLDVALVGFGVLRGEDSGAGSEAVRRAFCDERCLPDSVRGPVESLAFARFARVRGSGVGDWGLGIGVATGFVTVGLRSGSGWGQELLRASQRRTGSGSVVVGAGGAWAVVAIDSPRPLG